MTPSTVASIQLVHPKGKKAVTMDREKYNVLQPLVLKILKSKSATFSELTIAVIGELKAAGTKFPGSIPWHLEWIKLDLEGRKMIVRIPETSPQQYELV